MVILVIVFLTTFPRCLHQVPFLKMISRKNQNEIGSGLIPLPTNNEIEMSRNLVLFRDQNHINSIKMVYFSKFVQKNDSKSTNFAEKWLQFKTEKTENSVFLTKKTEPPNSTKRSKKPRSNNSIRKLYFEGCLKPSTW